MCQGAAKELHEIGLMKRESKRGLRAKVGGWRKGSNQGAKTNRRLPFSPLCYPSLWIAASPGFSFTPTHFFFYCLCLEHSFSKLKFSALECVPGVRPFPRGGERVFLVGSKVCHLKGSLNLC